SKVNVPWLRTPPPVVPPPLVIVKPAMVALTPAGTTNTGEFRSPATVSVAGPGPAIRTPAPRTSGPDVSWIVFPASDGLNEIESPLAAEASAARSDPGPASAAELTTTVLGSQRFSNVSTPRRARPALRNLRRRMLTGIIPVPEPGGSAAATVL